MLQYRSVRLTLCRSVITLSARNSPYFTITFCIFKYLFPKDI